MHVRHWRQARDAGNRCQPRRAANARMSKARCDSHVHIVGSLERYPQLPSRTYLANLASLENLRRLPTPRDIPRFAIVQPSFYGTDNTLLSETLDILGARGRGVVVVDPDAISGET